MPNDFQAEDGELLEEEEEMEEGEASEDDEVAVNVIIEAVSVWLCFALSIIGTLVVIVVVVV